MSDQRTMLCSVKTIKDMGAISENVDDKYISSAIWEAQEFKLVTILGYRLLEKLKSMVDTNALRNNQKYKLLADLCSNYLQYQALANLCLITSIKLTNAGVVTTQEDKATNLNMKDLSVIRGEYQSMADYKLYVLQGYLRDFRSEYPELNENTGCEQKPNLNTMENCGIWLGGKRGK